MLAASGALEAAVTLLCLKEGSSHRPYICLRGTPNAILTMLRNAGALILSMHFLSHLDSGVERGPCFQEAE